MGFLSITVRDHTARNIVFSGRFDHFPVRIGRQPGNEVCLDYPFLSRSHAVINEGPDGALKLCGLAVANKLMIATTPLEAGVTVPVARRLVATLQNLELLFEPEAAVAADPPGASDLLAAELPVIPVIPFIPLMGPASPFQHGVIHDDPDLPALDTDDGSHAARRARLQIAVATLRPLHKQFDQARRAWEDACMRTLQDLRNSASFQQEDLRIAFREFPAGDRPGVARDDDPLVGMGELGAVGRMASELLPGLQTPTSEPEIRRFLARAVDVLRVFAGCTLALHRVRGQQSTELGVTWDALPDPLAILETREDLLRYLLDWRDAGEARSEELVRSFAGLVDHLQCYVQAAMNGAREVVFTLSPSEMERNVTATWPTRTAALWRHYEACFASLCGDTYDHLTPAFRAALARAYGQALARTGVPFATHDSGAL